MSGLPRFSIRAHCSLLSRAADRNCGVRSVQILFRGWDGEAAMSENTVNVRYLVNDIEAAIQWYTEYLGFALRSKQLPAFADVTLGSLRLLLSGPASSAGRP